MTRSWSIWLVGAVLFAATPAAAQTLSDAQIAAIVTTANQVDVDAGRLAAERASTAQVKQFASLMVSDHTAVNQSAIELATRLKVVPEENETSRALKAGGVKNVGVLKALKGDAFDRAYITQEVSYHQAVIDALDKQLIPNAHNAELKALLVKVRPSFVAHLEHARKLQAGGGGKP